MTTKEYLEDIKISIFNTNESSEEQFQFSTQNNSIIGDIVPLKHNKIDNNKRKQIFQNICYLKNPKVRRFNLYFRR